MDDRTTRNSLLETPNGRHCRGPCSTSSVSLVAASKTPRCRRTSSAPEKNRLFWSEKNASSGVFWIKILWDSKMLYSQKFMDQWFGIKSLGPLIFGRDWCIDSPDPNSSLEAVAIWDRGQGQQTHDQRQGQTSSRNDRGQSRWSTLELTWYFFNLSIKLKCQNSWNQVYNFKSWLWLQLKSPKVGSCLNPVFSPILLDIQMVDQIADGACATKVKGEEKVMAPEEVSSMVLTKMKEKIPAKPSQADRWKLDVWFLFSGDRIWFL